MYKPTSPQSSFLEPDNLFPDLLPKDDWSYFYRDKVFPLIDEKRFKHLYAEEGGAPNKSIKLKVSLLIFMSNEKLNWRDTEFMFRRRVDWMNATGTPLGEASIDFTTLFKFYDQLANDDAAYQLFVDLTAAFIKECGVSVKKQRTDSFFMLGWLAILSRYGLFKETIRAFLQVLRKHQLPLYEQLRSELSRDYLKDEFDLTEKEKDKANRKVKEMAQDLYRLKEAFEKQEDVRHYGTFKTLVEVFNQQCEIKDVEDSSKEELKPLPEIEIREKPQGEKIISSPYNTDAEYTRKGDQTVVGHKGFLSETCDPENEVQFLTDVNLERAKHADSTENPLIEERLEENGFKPDTHYGDAGFVNGETILESLDRGINLAGPSSGRSQSLENFEREDRPLDVADFNVEIDEVSKELIVISCPNGCTPEDQKQSNKTEKTLVHFSTEACADCPLATRCPIKIGKQIATLTIDEKQYAGAERHHQYMGDPDYRKECGIRAGAESLVNEIANAHGARKSRHKTEERSRLQLIFAALGCNVKRFVNHSQNCVQNPVKLAISV